MAKKRTQMKPTNGGKDKDNKSKSIIKAVMFVPCTIDSMLCRELRSAENIIGARTGAKLKMVERCGGKLMDILTTPDPWKGSDCMREGCLLCITKAKTGKNTTQECNRRSIVYETRCITCENRAVKAIEEKFGAIDIENEPEKEKAKNEEISKIRLYKYIGETGKSAFERGNQHQSDKDQLKPNSHLLKHYIDKHENEDINGIEFGMKIRFKARSAFERQVMESVLIQQDLQRHNILNSKSEYNRCALPRLTTKIGDKEFTDWRKEKLDEKERKDEELESKIRDLRRTRNKQRHVDAPNMTVMPPQKKRKTNIDEYKTVYQMLKDWKKEERENQDKELENDEHPEHPERKKNKITRTDKGSRDQLTGETCIKTNLEPETQNKPDGKSEQETFHGTRKDIYTGETLTGKTCIKNTPEIESKTPTKIITEEDNETYKYKTINWDQHLRTHREQLEADLNKKENQAISANKMITNYNQSWELLKECMEIIEENNKKWKAGQEERAKHTRK